jgi:cell pole-organizing protein PopZ
MSAQPKPSEPSMEEILASIRRIISDDEKPAEEPAAPPPQDPDLSALLAGAAAQTQPEEDVLDLAAEASLIEAPKVYDSADIDFLETAEPEPAPAEPPPPPVEAYVPPPPPPAPMPEPTPAFDMASLLSDQTSTAVNSAFGQLAHTVLSNNARTLEDLVKDMLKPMLKSWLDDNLPTMVERLVRAEIERVARGGRH